MIEQIEVKSDIATLFNYCELLAKHWKNNNADIAADAMQELVDKAKEEYLSQPKP
jgi:hypothetical protein